MLGSNINIPFQTSSIPFTYRLLQGLHYKTDKGIFKVENRRVGSKVCTIFPEPVDHYELYLNEEANGRQGSKLMDFFIYSYSRNPDTEDDLPGGLLFIKGKLASPLPAQTEADAGKSYLDAAMKVNRDDPAYMDKFMILLNKAAELDNAEAQELLFAILTKIGGRDKQTHAQAMKWWHRAQRTKQGLKNSPATDYRPSVLKGDGCLSLVAFGLLFLVFSISLVM